MLQFRGPLCLWQCFTSCSGVGFYLLSWVGCSWVGDQPATGELVPPAARTSSILPSTWTTSSLPQEQISASMPNIVVTIVTTTRCHKTNHYKIEHHHTAKVSLKVHHHQDAITILTTDTWGDAFHKCWPEKSSTCTILTRIPGTYDPGTYRPRIIAIINI